VFADTTILRWFRSQNNTARRYTRLTTRQVRNEFVGLDALNFNLNSVEF